MVSSYSSPLLMVTFSPMVTPLIRPDFRCTNIKIQFNCVPVKRDHFSHNATVFLIAEGMALYIG